MDTFDNKTLNLVLLGEIVLAVLITRGGALTSFLDTRPLTPTQWLFGALPAVVLFLVWEALKAFARSRASDPVEAAGIPRQQAAAVAGG